jgi:glycogen operon protein
VILDVVYNHTAEGDHSGPTLSFKGIDNASYYRLAAGRPDRYLNPTGTGNALDLAHPAVLRLVMDSLRHWVTEYHVDGFRFDLAPTLARVGDRFDPRAPFLAAVHQDPVLSGVKLVAEPWDLGPGGYQAGAFPAPWSEWNDAYRDGVRDFWRGRAGVAELAVRLAGSSDVYGSVGRAPQASVNFVTAHDGYTLADLVAYEHKRNEANLECNHDGSDDNRSWNCGVEGPTDDVAVLALRARQRRNLLATLLLSQGVPMLLGGDELGRTQAGNNNAWCQDNEVSWFDWDIGQEAGHLLAFVRRLVALRQAHPAFRRRHFLAAEPQPATGRPEAGWFRAVGQSMAREDWDRGGGHVGLLLDGTGGADVDERGGTVVDDSFLLLANAEPHDVTFIVPATGSRRQWVLELSTARPDDPAGAWSAGAGAGVSAPARSVTVLQAK